MGDETGPFEFKNRRSFKRALRTLSRDYERVENRLLAAEADILNEVGPLKEKQADRLMFTQGGNGCLAVSLGGVNLTAEIPVEVRGYRIVRERDDGLFLSNNFCFSQNLFGRATVDYPCFYAPSFATIYVVNESRIRRRKPLNELENGPIFFAHEVGHALASPGQRNPVGLPEDLDRSDLDRDLKQEREAWSLGIRWWRQMEDKHRITFWSGSNQDLRKVIDQTLWSLLVQKFGPLVQPTHAGVRDAGLNPSSYRKGLDRLGIR